jgi:hypothetical protein
MIIDIKPQTLTEDLKQKVYKGFSRHAVAMTGNDEKFDAIALVASTNGVFLGVVVVELFWGALLIRLLLLRKVSYMKD